MASIDIATTLHHLPTKRDALSLLVLSALGLFLRLRGINTALDADEIFSLQAALGPWSHTLQVALGDRPHPPLHLFLLHIWIDLFGSSAAAVRSLSVVASMVFLVALWAVATRLASRWITVIATAICAIAAYFVYYGQQARPYSLAGCLAVLSVWTLLRWLESPQSHSRAILYILVCALLMLTEYVGVVFVVAEWLALAFLYRFPISAVAASATSIVPAGLWFAAAHRQSALPLDTFLEWINRPRFADLLKTLVTFSGWPVYAHGGVVLLVVVLIAFASAAIAFLRAKQDERRLLLTIVTLTVSVPSALFVLSRFAPNSYWAPRQMIGSAAMLSLITAYGLSRCKLPLRVIAVIVLFSCAVWCSWQASPAWQHPAWDQVAKTASDQCRKCQVIAFEPWVSKPLSYYLGHRVGMVPALPNSSQQLILVCRDMHCPLPGPEGVRHVAQYDWAQPASRIEVFVVSESGN